MPGDEAPSTYAFDPHHPVPTVGGQIDSGKDLSPDGPRDQLAVRRSSGAMMIFPCPPDATCWYSRRLLWFPTS
jgi:hypothetical protein